MKETNGTAYYPVLQGNQFVVKGPGQDGAASLLSFYYNRAVIISDVTGTIPNTIKLKDDYVGYHTFGPEGVLVFYGMDLDDGPVTSVPPLSGTIYRLLAPKYWRPLPGRYR